MNLKELAQFKNASGILASSLRRYSKRYLWLLIFLLAVYALIIFGLYATSNPKATEINTKLQIKEDIYQKVIERLQARDTQIKQGIEQVYPDIFK